MWSKLSFCQTVKVEEPSRLLVGAASDDIRMTLPFTVTVSADALPCIKMSGVVKEIGNTPVNQGTDVLYTVHILLNNPDPRLRWGMTMEVTFPINK